MTAFLVAGTCQYMSDVALASDSEALRSSLLHHSEWPWLVCGRDLDAHPSCAVGLLNRRDVHFPEISGDSGVRQSVRLL
jgi:hypothetical protein